MDHQAPTWPVPLTDTIRSIEAGVHHRQQDPSCRPYKGVVKTIQHIIAGCKMQVDAVYPSWDSVQGHLCTI